MKNPDLWSSTAWSLIGLGFVLGGLRLGVGRWNSPSPGFMPVIIGGILFVLSAALWVKSLWTRKLAQDTIGFWKGKGSWVRILLSLSALVFYLFFLNYLGYLLTTFIFIHFLTQVVSKKGWAWSAVIALLASITSYAMFKIWLEVPLPMGFFI